MAKQATGKRPYNKKSEYWDRISKQGKLASQIPDSFSSDKDIRISMAGVSDASSLSRFDRDALDSDIRRRFPNLFAGIHPTQKGANSLYSIREAVLLCKLAYSNVAIVNSTIESMVDFSDSPLEVTEGPQKSKDIVNQWLKTAKIASVKQQWFREFYMSGNVPIIRFRAESRQIPIRYFIINPFDIAADAGMSLDVGYKKRMAPHEIEKLRNPKTIEDRQLLQSLPQETQKQIKDSSGFSEIFVPLDRKNFIINFYNKQDYDLFAIPLIWPVIKDVEHKLNLKDMDRKLAKTVDKIILLITSGKDGKVNPDNIQSIKDQVKDAQNGIVLVTDDLTNGKFLIPDMQNLLGKDKYEVVNEDIRTGLHNILVGSEKFANQFVKTKMFLERLEKGRNKFLEEFLLPEIEEVCESFGVPVPKVEFHKIFLEDANQRNRNINRLIELGVLSPDTGFEIMESGIWPDWEQLMKDQKKLKKAKDEGLFLGQNDKKKGEEGRPAGEEKEQEVERNTNVMTGRAESVRDQYQSLIKLAEKKIKEAAGKKRLNKAQKDIVGGFVLSVIANSHQDKWKENLQWCFDNKQSLPENEEMKMVVEEIKEKYSFASSEEAALIYHFLKS